MTESTANDSMILKAVQAAAISPADARKLVANLRSRMGGPDAGESETEFNARIAEGVADRIVARYSKLAATSGGLSALAGVIPGVGTIAAMTVGASADIAVCMKLQVDMCCCIAEAFGWDLGDEDARQLCFLIAGGASLEQAAVSGGTRVASKAGVKMLQMYLKGAVLQTLKEMFKKIGIVFTRKALERALPFGIGVVLGSSANYALTRYVGRQARDWFQMERAMKAEEQQAA